jgi:NAD(P)-dependent dehydrogenase (short-subunit alcohol dehydrogenase family)
MGLLSGRHALVTGGGSGIGAAVAQALSQADARVTIVGRRKAPLQEVAARLPMVAVVASDVTQEADCEAMMQAARAAHGPIDIVVANAGAAESAPAEKIDAEHWQRMIGVNLTGAFQTVHAALGDVTRGTEGGRIVFVASTAGLKGYPYVAAYCAAKHGVIGLMRALSLELARKRVTVNAVCPGYAETPLLEASVGTIVAKTGRTPEESRAALARANAGGRLIEPEEVAQTVVWLCSPAASAVSGQAIAIAGGAL